MEQDAKRATPERRARTSLRDEYFSNGRARSRHAPEQRSARPSGATHPDPRRCRGFCLLVCWSLYHLVQPGRARRVAIVGVDHNGRTTEHWRQSPTIMIPAPAGIDTLARLAMADPAHPLYGREFAAHPHQPDVAVDPGTETYAALERPINQGSPRTAIAPLTRLHQSIEVAL
jgi:hypothetical protein